MEIGGGNRISMALYKISDFDTDYRKTIQNNDIRGLGVYTQETNDKIGTVSDVLVDEQGQFRYLIVDVGFWIFGKQVLLPLGRSKIDSIQDRVYTELSKQQAEVLPEYKEGTVLDYDYEEKVRGVYRPTALESKAPVAGAASTSTYDRSTYNYAQDSDLYHTDDNQSFKLYEEKHVETETARVQRRS